jgi:tetratricopeptide (TPR) repeat protein
MTLDEVNAERYNTLLRRRDIKMHANTLIWLVLASLVFYLIWSRRGNGVIAREMRTMAAMNAVMSAYRARDYARALQKTEGMRNGSSKTAEYCFYRGAMLHHLGQLTEAEASLRDALPLQPTDQLKALSYNTLAMILMDQERFTEAITFFESAGRAWPDRGSNQRGIAEVWLRQGRELSEAMDHARRAVEIDRAATGMKKEALDLRLAEDLAVLAWAVANSGGAEEVESLLIEAFTLCGTNTKPILAQLHYHAGKAYAALKDAQNSQAHFRQAAELDPQGTVGRFARALLS